MAGITPIPTTRVSDYFVSQRLINQIQGDQLDLFKLQTQVSTGRRILRPSDDPAAALRAIALQRTLQRKGQAESNLNNSRSVLEVAETALGSVAGTLNDVRAAALENISNLTSPEARDAAIAQVDAALSALITSGNANYNGRYLFGGSRTNVSPFELSRQNVVYKGNQKKLQSYVDLEQLFTTNLPGTDVFGGVSGQVVGSVDLDPPLTVDTLLASLHGGNGIDTNSAISINVNNGGTTSSSVIDLSGAVTVGDVIRRIEANPPAGGASIRVDIVDNGLAINASAGTVRVGEVAAGRAAKELGFATNSAPSATVVGSDLDPVLRNTTPLANLLGTKAAGRLVSINANNDIAITAAANGAEWDGVTVVYASGGLAGSENATYDSGTKTLTVQIEDGQSTANDVIAAINAEGTFTAQLDGRDSTSAQLAGTGAVTSNDFGIVTSGGSGESLDTVSGLVLTNGGESVVVDISTAETVEDLFNLIAAADVGLKGEINAAGTGINVRSVLSGADFTIGENGGTTAIQLGIRSYTGATQLADFNHGIGVGANDTAEDDFVIVARDGTELGIDLTSAKTVQDVIDLVNNHPLNNTGTTAVEARLATTGNGIELVDASTDTTGSLVVRAAPGNPSAQLLGFLPDGETEVSSSSGSGGSYSLASEDRHTLEVDSVFNTLIRLRKALEDGDSVAIGQAIDKIDADLDRVTFARGEIGTRLQTLDVVQTRLEDETVQLKSALSNEVDVDLVEAISNMTARQYALQASLQTAANILNLSILDYI